MNALAMLYKSSLGLLTDLYQLTMAYGYWKTGRHDQEAVFHLFFRKHPFGGGFTVAAGLATVVEYLEELRFDPEDLAYLAGLRGNDEQPLFEPAFLEYLARMRLGCDVHGIPEGTIVFPHEPLLRVTGPLLQAQLLETALLNIVNFQTLVATKAARVALAARGEPVLEFGLRRAQGIDGALAASRAAYLGGCAQRPTSWPAGCSASPFEERTPIAGSCASTTSWRRSGPTPRRCPTTACSSSIPTTRSTACGTRSRWGRKCAGKGTK